MKHQFLLFSSILLFYSCSISKKTNPIYPALDNLSWKEYPINSSVRAIEILDDNTIWYTGSKGQFGYTENAGASWTIDSLQFDTFNLEFRSMALVGNSVFILSVASPALLFESKNKGKTWNLVYREDDPKAFYDAMTFWDAQNGIAIGDPTNGCMSVIITRNGGKSWDKLDCDQLSETAEGEAAFAASNTNVVTYKDNVWIVTGGAKARVFRSNDKGMHWSVSDTPIDQGGQMTGIFSVDFYDENKGIIYGGNWENKREFNKCKAITKDGGKTWDLIKGEPGYMSCVQFIPGTKGNGIIACGSEGLAVSKDSGNTWNSISDKGYYSIRMEEDGTSAWLSGNNKIAHLKWD